MSPKKICIITACRSEYGLLRWTMEEIRKQSDLILQVLVTGAHLSPEYGCTYKEIERDGFVIDKKVDMLLSSGTVLGIAKSMGLCAIGIADAFSELDPDFVIVLGDRYELMPICSTALVMRIPIAHISGGDITEGAIDDEIRNAVTKMADLHFPGTNDARNKIIAMGEKPENVFAVGEPGLENFIRIKLLNRKDLSTALGLDFDKRWVLLTYHSETKISIKKNLTTVSALIESLMLIPDIQVVATYANADAGGIEINRYLDQIAREYSGRLFLYKSLGQERYLSIMKECVLVAGNSSSGIIEAPFIGKSVLNVGNRQRGRFLASNISNCSNDSLSIKEAIENFEFIDHEPNTYWGDGHTASKIIEILRSRI